MPIPSWITPDPPTTDGLEEPIVIAHSETEEYAMESPPSATVQLRCKWTQRHTILENILTFFKPWPYGGQERFAINGGIACVPESKTIADGNGNAYEYAFLNINFGWVQGGGEGSGPDGAGEGVFFESIEPHGEFITLPGKDTKGKYTYAYVPNPSPTGDDFVPEDASPGKLVLGFDWQLKWARVDYIPGAILTLYNKINQYPIQSPTFGFTFPAQTLLISSANISRTFGADGSIKQAFEMRYSYKENTWNKFYKAKDETWSRIYKVRTAGGSNPPVDVYTPASFAALLPAGAQLP